jgi:phosphate transport system substrate-binding protein
MREGKTVKSLVTLGLAAALVAGVPLTPASAQDVLGDTGITGAGSTFAFPVMSRWAQGYQRWLAAGGEFPSPNAGLDSPSVGSQLDYEPVGSLAGTMRARQGAVDFGASDVPLKSDELAKLGLGQFPIVIGGVVVAVNLDGIAAGGIRLSGPVLAEIYLGNIQIWSHPAIAGLNPNLKLPDTKIAVVRRSDGSGTTYNFTNYLSRVSAKWRDTIGSDLVVAWPVGVGVKGNEGVGLTVRQTKNSIGYVEYAQATQMKLSYALIQNSAGQFVKPDPQSFQAAAAGAGADWAKAGDFDLLLVDAPGADAYPIVATVFAQMQKSSSPRRARAAFNFFQWCLDRGADDAAALGYVPLPASLVTQVKAYWVKNFALVF